MHHKVRNTILLLLATLSLQGCGWVAVGLLSQSGGSSGGGGNPGALSLPPQVLTLQVTNTPDQSRATDLSQILLNFSLIHPTAVPADVLVEFSTDGVNFNSCNITTIIADSQNLPDGTLTDLPTSSTGVPFTMTWAADQGNLSALSQVSIRITASNAAGSSIPAVVENILVGNDAPIASALRLTNASANDIGVLVVSEIVILEFELNDTTRDPTNIIFEFFDPSLVDDPMTPQNEQVKVIPPQDIIAGQSTNLLPDLPGAPAPLKFNLVWQAVQTVGPVDLSGVRLRITPTDNLTNGQGVTVETAPFILLNNQPPVSTLQEPAFTNDDSGSLRLAFALGDPEEDGVDVILQFSTDPNGFPPLEDALNDPGQRRKILLDPDERRRRGIITPKVKTLFESRSTFATTGSGVDKVTFATNPSLIDPTTTLALTLPGEFRSISLLQALIGTKVQMLSNGGGVIFERNVIGFDINSFSYILDAPFPNAIPLGTLFRFRESIASLFLGRKSSQQGQVGEVAWDAAADLGLGQEGAGVFIKLTPFSNLQRGQSSQSNFPVQLDTSALNLDEAGILSTNEEGTALATADVDLDGDLDLIVAEFDRGPPGKTRILLYRNNGQSFGADSFPQNPMVLFDPVANPITKDLKDIEAADLNGDGLPEIIFSDNATNLLIISGADLSGPNPPAPLPLPLSSAGQSIIIKDIDGDNFVDIAVLSPADDAVTIFFGAANFLTGPRSQVTVSTAGQGQGFVQHFDIADLNKDGKLDVVLEERGNQVLVFLNDTATGRFSGIQANPLSFNAGGIKEFLLLDVNSDLNPDLVYYDSNGGGRIAVSPGDGFGSFLTNKQPPSLNLDGKMLTALDAADVNGDGLLDLIVTNRNGNSINIFPGLGNGEFRDASNEIIRIDTPLDLVIADFGSNGTLDLVVCTGESESIEFLCNNSKTPFLLANQRLDTDSAATRIGTTDINADGVPDVVILARRLANGNQDEGLRLFVGAGNANYQPPFKFDLTDNPQDFAITDLGNDGTLDAVVIQDTSVSIVPLSSTSTSASILTPLTGLPGGMASISLGDFNGDDVIDAVACNKATGVIVVIPGTATSPFFGTPATVFTEALGGPSQVRFADMNGDGIVDIVAALPDSNEIKILFNNPASLGDFSTVAPVTFDFQALPGPSLFRLADFNSDGQADILVSTLLDVALISSTGIGTFDPTPRSLGPNFTAPGSLSIGDIDKDGFKDIVVSDVTDYVILLGKGNGTFVPGAPFKIESTQPLDGRDILLVELNGDGDLDFIAGQGNNAARIYLSDSRRPVNRFFDGAERANFPTLDIQNNPIDRDIAAGNHIINTDAGTIDGEPIPSFNGKSFFFKNFTIQDNAIVLVVGQNPFNLRCMGSCTIAGTLDLSGAGGANASTFIAGAGGLGGPGAGRGGDGAGFLRTKDGFFQAFPSIDGQTGSGLGRGFPGLRNGDTPGSGGGGAFSAVGGSADGIPGIPYSNDMLTLLFGGSGGSGGSLRESITPLNTPDTSDLAGGGGGGGGGLLHIVAEVVDISGSILSNGGKGGKGAESPQAMGLFGGHGGGGSGGAILIQGRQTIEFTGTGSVILNAKGGPGENGSQGTGSTPSSGVGKDGYIRLEDQDGVIIVTGVTIDPQPTTGTFVDTASISIIANGAGVTQGQ